MIKLNCFCTLAALVLLVLPGCSNQEARSKSVVTIAMDQEVQTLDPRRNNDTYSSRVVWQLYESLVGLDEAGDLVPKIAESWSSNDNRIWTFRIREGVRFHDDSIFRGKPRFVNASDVQYSLEQHTAPGSFSSFVLSGIVDKAAEFNQGKAASITGIEVLSPNEVRFKLTHPEPEFPFRLADPSLVVLCREAVEHYGDRLSRDVAVGTGPFRLTSRAPLEVILTRNNRYWKPDPPHAAMSIRFVVARSAQAALVEAAASRVDILDLSPEAVASLEKNGAMEQRYSQFYLLRKSLYNVNFLGFNLDRVNDVHFRKAIALALDRRAIVIGALQGQAAPASSLVPSGMRTCSSQTIASPNVLAAEAELAQTKIREIEILVNDARSATRVGELIQSQLEPLGIAVKLTRLDFGAAIQRIVGGQTPAFVMFFDYVYGSPALLFDTVKSTNIPVPNFWRYKSPEMDKTIEGFNLAKTPAEVCDVAQRAEQTLAADVPAVFLFRTDQSLLVGKSLTGVKLTPVNLLDLQSLAFLNGK